MPSFSAQHWSMSDNINDISPGDLLHKGENNQPNM
jgi:hypothetical protein